ncbi:MAG: hypothetical protein IKB28_11320 [Clostridia bacterium]|nr:hypothetical protein [Clostridia bacterium]
MKQYKNYANGPLMATDALGRTTADRENAPARRENRLVGMFYFLWLGEHGRHKPYDISKITAEHPDAGQHPDADYWGGIGTYHHWGEPFYGYYYSDDEWVVRRHMKLLIQADIDFLFFDTTNACIYEHNVKLVMRVLDEYARDGWKIPKVMFYTNTHSGKTVQEIYDKIYAVNYCPDTWFCFEGKPVIIAVENECSPECREFFNIKMSQWPNEPDKLGGWPWMDFTRPQRVFANLKGEDEVINVSVAQHPQLRFGDSVMYGENGNCGRGFHEMHNDPDPDAYLYGYNFAEQFERAIETDPPIVLVTGWNEWIAGHWQGIPERPIMFVDCANYEYSRDIEMMRGGYFDNYFMQLVDYVRKYKGVDEYEDFAQLAPVDYYNDTEQDEAEEVWAEYHNFSDGDFARCAQGSGTVYENHTQRNAITGMTVSHDDDFIYFGIVTKDEIKPWDGQGSWMKIYLNTDGGKEYQYVLNNTPYDDHKTTVAVIVDGLRAADFGDVVYRCSGNMLLVIAPRAVLGLDRDDFTVWFKAADSTEELTSIEDFYDKGDAAPLGRLNYVYRGTKNKN